MFTRYALRTTDADAARRFYAEAISLELPNGRDEASILEAWPLHEQARARGAPAHWLGQIAVDDVDAAVEAFVARGASRLGPTVEDPSSGVSFATVRDPSGAVVGLRAKNEPAPDERPVVLHQLHTAELDRDWPVYRDLFGFRDAGVLAADDPPGGFRLFADDAGERPTGFVGNTARWPGVHPHWLYHFPVPDLDAAVARARALGATVRDPVHVPGLAVRLAAGDDPQGAAFGLVERVG